MEKHGNSNHQQIRGTTHGHVDEHQKKGKIVQEIEKRKNDHTHTVSKNQEKFEKQNVDNQTE